MEAIEVDTWMDDLDRAGAGDGVGGGLRVRDRQRREPGDARRTTSTDSRSDEVDEIERDRNSLEPAGDGDGRVTWPTQNEKSMS